MLNWSVTWVIASDMASQSTIHQWRLGHNKKDCATKRFKRKKFMNYLSYYHDYLEEHQKTVPSGYEDFVNMLVLTQDRFCRQLAAEKDIEIKTVSKPMTLTGSSINDAVFFWMVPGKAMIFAFPNFSGVGRGASFKSSDEHLMNIFLEQFNNRWNKGHAISHHCYSTPQLFTTTYFFTTTY